MVGHTSGGDFQIRIVLSLRETEAGREKGKGERKKWWKYVHIIIEELTYFWLTSVGLKRSSF